VTLRPGDLLRGDSGRGYRVRGWHAEGSYSRLYRGEDEAARPCALKLARPEAPGAPARLEREAAIRREFRHPGVPELRDTGAVAGIPFLALAWIEGSTLRTLLDSRRGFPLARALDVARDVAEVIAHLHAAGLAHGDLRADNILVLPAGSRPAAVVTDLGSASRRGAAEYEHASQDDGYRLAALLFQMLAGVSPEENPNALATARGHHPGVVRLWEEARGGRLPEAQFLRQVETLRAQIGRG
jgi:serine/threonine protein kinase